MAPKPAPKIKPLVIGICGGSGSGKTTLLQKLEDYFPPEQLCLISQDNYYKERGEHPVDAKGVTNFDLPSCIDHIAFADDISKLIKGDTVKRREYVFNNDLAKPKILTFLPTPIIIVEGLFVFYFTDIQRLMDFKIYVHAKENLKIIRRIRRDQIERNYPIDDVLYRYEHHVMPTFEKYILPYREEADLVINNNDNLNKGFQVLKGFLAQWLQNR